jgi:hypothetical protein
MERSNQPKAELQLLKVLPAAMIAMGVVGSVVALSAQPRADFERYCFGTCLAAIGCGALLYLAILFARRPPLIFRALPRERFVPAGIAGAVFLLFLGVLYFLALNGAPPIYSGTDQFLLIWITVILVIGAIWDAVALRRSILDGAWRQKSVQPPTHPAP